MVINVTEKLKVKKKRKEIRWKKSESNATQVALTNLELDAAGLYSCEVSADEPSFHTAMISAIMNVVGKY
ncbi:hypothetical protein M0804_015397 [Polistes exclamans]|nr:hypothetical protein M0804_015398 [Polistes exclamans]KAI4473319.1 hypothetical protein M0804_015397 [Polistes exclamans]